MIPTEARDRARTGTAYIPAAVVRPMSDDDHIDSRSRDRSSTGEENTE